MIMKWMKGKRHNEKGPTIKKIGHIFKCGNELIYFDRFSEGQSLPYDYMELSINDAIQLKEFLDKAIDKHAYK